MGPLLIAVLFAYDQTRLVAILAGDPDSRWTTRISRDLLLLPQSLLPFFLSGSTCMRRWRIKGSQISRRDRISTDSPESTSLFSLPRPDLPCNSLVRRNSRLLV